MKSGADGVIVICALLPALLLGLSCAGGRESVAPSVSELESPTNGAWAPCSNSSGRNIEPYAPGEVLVVFRDRSEADAVSQEQAVAWLAKRGLRIQEVIDAGWGIVYRLSILDGTPVAAKAAELQAFPWVQYAEPNITFHFHDAAYSPNDPFWENPNDSDEDPRSNVFEQFGPSKTGASAVWTESVAGQDVVVCVMDSGIQVWHEDIKNTMWVNEDEVPANGIDDDDNGYIDDIYGWDTYGNDNDITEYNADQYYHGTSCAGVISAEQDNGLGCSGIAPQARIMGIRIGFGSALLSEIVEGVFYARKNGADIISMSFGTDTYSPILKNSMDQAWKYGMILTASAGNDDSTNVGYPAGFGSVVCVGGTSPFGGAWTYRPMDEVRISKAAGFFWGSNYGPALEVMGFGENYITLYGSNDHAYYDGKNDSFFRGTSNACPMVSAVFALLKSVFPAESNEWLRERLVHTADDLDVPGYDQQTGWGRVNAVRACFGPDRYAAEQDANGFVDLGAHDAQVIDSIHASTPPYSDTEDRYKFTASQDGCLNFFLDIWTWGEDLELMLYKNPSLDPASKVSQSVQENHAVNSFEVVGTECKAGETFYLVVVPRKYGDSSTYTLTAEYVQPFLSLETQTYDPGFIHKGRNNILLGHLDFSASMATRITRISFNLQGTMPGSKLKGLRLHKDTYRNGTFDSLDAKVADAHLSGTNRAVFSGLYEEVASQTGPVRYYVLCDISDVIEDASYQLVLSSYKDVVTDNGIQIAYESFPYVLGPYEVGVDVEPPVWETTVGAQQTVPRYKGAAVFWNKASEPRTPPVKYNVYWTEELPFDFSTAQCQKNVSCWNAGTCDCGWIVPGLENYHEYYVIVRAEDQAGNEDTNVAAVTVVPDDICNPSWPQVVGTFDIDGNNAREVKADPTGDRVFLADQNKGLLIIDVSDPANPSLAGSIEGISAFGVDYNGERVFCASSQGLVIVDPDAAGGPAAVATVAFQNALDLCVAGDWVYVTNTGTELLPVNVSVPENPVVYSPVTSGNCGYALCAHEGYLYVATFDHPRVFDLAEPSAPVHVKSFGAAQAHDILVDGDRLYVAYWGSTKVGIYDIATPSNPVYLGEKASDSGSYGAAVVLFNGYLYFGTNSYGIEVFDIVEPASISEVGQIATNGPDGMDTDGVFIYSAENEHGLKIIL